MQTLAIASQKGGCGKTTLAVNLAYALASMEKRTLLIDLDSQGNASRWLRGEKPDNVARLLALEDHRSLITSFESLDVISGGIDTSRAEVELRNDSLGPDHGRLALALEKIEGYDYVILDSPFGLGLMTIQGLVAAQGVIIPVEAEVHAVEGARVTMEMIHRIRQRYNAGLELYGMVIMNHDRRIGVQKRIVQELRNVWGSLIYKTIIRTDGRVPTSAEAAVPVARFAPRSKAKTDFHELTSEILGGYAR